MAKINKFTIIGAGSSYTPELINGLLTNYDQFNIQELMLYDIDKYRLNIVSQMVNRQISSSGHPINLKTSINLEESVENSEFIVSQIRVGRMQARVLDEKIPFKYDILGQETTGPGGTFNAWRTIPETLKIVKIVEKFAPQAWFLNFTNPSGIVTEAIIKHSTAKVIGLCDVPVNAQGAIAEAFGNDPKRIFLEWMGMNHVNWIKRVLLDGSDVTNKVIELIEKGVSPRLNHRFPCDIDLVKALGVLPNYYLQYYYHHPKVMSEHKAKEKTRGETVLEIEKLLFSKYLDPKQIKKPDELSLRGGASYSAAVIPMIRSILHDTRDIQIVVTRNNGAIKDLEDDAVVEIPCMLGSNGATPLQLGRFPSTIRGLAQKVKSWESLTVEAGVSGSWELALAALIENPLIPSAEIAKEILNEMMDAHRRYLPQFFKK